MWDSILLYTHHCAISNVALCYVMLLLLQSSILIGVEAPHWDFWMVSLTAFSSLNYIFSWLTAFNLWLFIIFNQLSIQYLYIYLPYLTILIHCSFTVPKPAYFTIICESQWISLSWPCWSFQIHLCPTVMSTTSATTASVARYCILNNVADLSNCMCLYLLTKADGTLFNASSILKEDIIKICIRFRHTYPKGLLQYSAIKLVMLFNTTCELQITACGVMKASTLHDEAIKVKTYPPPAAYVRASMAAVNWKPSGTQPLPSDEEDPHSPPSKPCPGGRTPQTLGILWIMSCDSSWRISTGRLHSENWTHLPEIPPPTPWGNPLGNGDPDVDDWEVTFLRGGGWVPPEQPFWPLAPAQPDGGWKHRG